MLSHLFNLACCLMLNLWSLDPENQWSSSIKSLRPSKWTIRSIRVCLQNFDNARYINHDPFSSFSYACNCPVSRSAAFVHTYLSNHGFYVFDNDSSRNCSRTRLPSLSGKSSTRARFDVNCIKKAFEPCVLRHGGPSCISTLRWDIRTSVSLISCNSAQTRGHNSPPNYSVWIYECPTISRASFTTNRNEALHIP